MRKIGYIIQFLTEKKNWEWEKQKYKTSERKILKTQAPKRIHGLNFDFDLL